MDNSMQARRSLKRSLEPAVAKAMSLERVGRGKSPQVGTCPLDTHDALFFCYRRVFFRRSRLFFREAAFFSGGEGCEWGAKQSTVGKSGDKAENEFSGFIPLAVPRKGFSPHIPAPDFLFSSIHPKLTIPPQKRNIPYWYCLQCTPSLTLPPSSLKCLQKSNPNIHRKCFRCFRCFGCFTSLLDHKTARFWSKSEQTRRIVTIQLCNNMGALSVGMLF